MNNKGNQGLPLSTLPVKGQLCCQYKMNNKAQVVHKTILWIIAILVLILAMALLFGTDIIKILNILIPSFNNTNGGGNGGGDWNECGYIVGELVEGKYIYFCENGDCSELKSSDLFIEGQDLIARSYSKSKIGYLRDEKVIIYNSILEMDGQLWWDAAGSLPPLNNLVNLAGSKLFYERSFCRDSKIEFEALEGFEEIPIASIKYDEGFKKIFLSSGRDSQLIILGDEIYTHILAKPRVLVGSIAPNARVIFISGKYLRRTIDPSVIHMDNPSILPDLYKAIIVGDKIFEKKEK